MSSISPTRRAGLAAVMALSCLASCSDGGDPDGGDGPCEGPHCDDGATLALAGDLGPECDSPELFRITRPAASDGSADGTFSYGYRFKPPAEPGAPVLVFLPGGPGESSTATTPTFIPEGWGYLMTDPRGVGCNRLADTPEGELSGAFFRTQEIALDVIAAIADRDLDDFVLFGVSYGSVLATTVIHDIETTGGVTPPRAVVIEGVLGRAFGDDFPGAEYIAQWDRIRAALPGDVIAELDGVASPFGVDRVGWSRVLMGTLPRGPLATLEIIGNLSASAPAEKRQQMLAHIQAVAAEQPLHQPGEVELYRQVACRELMDTVPASDLDVVFDGGRLVRNSAEEGTKCGELRVSAPYDSDDLPFSTPVYYFIGDSDVATPAWQGAYHFDNHEGRAVSVVTINGGHNSLELNQEQCAPALMASIAAGGADLAQVAQTCPLAIEIDGK